VKRPWIPFVLLGAVVVAAVSVVRRPAPTSDPSPQAPADLGSPEAPPTASGPAHPGDPPLNDKELRDSRLRLAHELCEEGARRINQLAGKDPNDAQGAMRTMSVCLRHGNVAWYKCVLAATTSDQAAMCSRRLLTGDNVP
jgi:hypothetical protein